MFLLIGMYDQRGLETTALADFSGEGILSPSAGQEKAEVWESCLWKMLSETSNVQSLL